jgi:hypothetical protein
MHSLAAAVDAIVAIDFVVVMLPGIPVFRFIGGGDGCATPAVCGAAGSFLLAPLALVVVEAS